MGEQRDRLHHVTLRDLEPDTTYVYRVLDVSGRSSPEYRFTTAATDVDSFRFVVAADMQESARNRTRWPEVADAIAEEDPDLLFLPGDLAADDRAGFWYLFFDSARDLFATVPMLPILGNHDTPTVWSDPDTRSFRRYFALPQADSGTEDYYSVAYGSALFLALSTEDESSLRPGAHQWEWLERTLAGTWDGDERLYDWVFAGYHHPSYNAGARFSAEAERYRAFTELFDFHVDWAFSAHEHVLQRFEPLTHDAILADEYGVGPLDGVGYLVVPAAGGPLYLGLGDHGVSETMLDLLAYPDANHRGDDEPTPEHGYVVVDVEGEVLSVSSISIGDPGFTGPPITLDEVVCSAR